MALTKFERKAHKSAALAGGSSDTDWQAWYVEVARKSGPLLDAVLADASLTPSARHSALVQAVLDTARGEDTRALARAFADHKALDMMRDVIAEGAPEVKVDMLTRLEVIPALSANAGGSVNVLVLGARGGAGASASGARNRGDRPTAAGLIKTGLRPRRGNQVWLSCRTARGCFRAEH